MQSDALSQKELLAFSVVDLAKALVLADNHFLSAAVGRLEVIPGIFAAQFACDGYALGIDTDKVLETYVRTREAPKHDLLHSILHCLFLHPYVGPAIKRPLWNLACDISVEHNVAELCGPRPGGRGDAMLSAFRKISESFDKWPSAESIYKQLCDGKWKTAVSGWEELFFSDDHGPWYPAPQSDGPEAQTDQQGGQLQASGGSGSEQSEQQAGGGSGSEQSEQQNGADGPDNNASGGGDGADNNASGNGSGTDAGDGDQPSASGNSEQSLRSQGLGAGSAIADAYARRAGANLELVARESRDMEEASWRRVAKALEVNLQTMSKARGAGLGDLLGDLENVTQTRVDYRDFLRQFAIPGEVLRLSDDEYDYIFYTYGLKLYGNLPLIEPLEYREEKRIREFVIVIDTSGSVWGDIVRRFMETTFEILKSTESFFEKVNIRIIQCDARVQSDDKITTLEELRQWGSRMRLMGGGGTDFRPAFAYVDKLIEDGEFENLGGLVYFTDGWGEYPTHMPDYKTAFVFYDNDYRPENVPPWAIQAVLNDEEIYRMSR